MLLQYQPRSQAHLKNYFERAPIFRTGLNRTGNKAITVHDHVMIIKCSSYCRVITTSECPAYNVPTCTVSNPAYAQITRAQDGGSAYAVVNILT